MTKKINDGHIFLSTKESQFHQHLKKKSDFYFYQFHAESISHVKEIGEWIKDQKRDPHLNIFVGVSADHSTLSNRKELDRLKDIFNACAFYKDLTPVLHFSFRNSLNVPKDIMTIKVLLPFVTRLQMNDLPILEIAQLELALTQFTLDIPLCDDNFAVIQNKKFRDFIKKNNLFLLLDNSKGRGIQEPKESLIKKIDSLLKYDLTNIAIFGGFGPNELETYFELRKYYRMNFSIDAETKLKTEGHVNIEKTKVYLHQLICFNNE